MDLGRTGLRDPEQGRASAQIAPTLFPAGEVPKLHEKVVPVGLPSSERHTGTDQQPTGDDLWSRVLPTGQQTSDGEDAQCDRGGDKAGTGCDGTEAAKVVGAESGQAHLGAKTPA